MKRLFAFITRVISIVGHPIKAQVLKNSQRVRVLVLAQDSILLIRSSIGSQRWSLPGGGIKKSESPKTAAIRELFEETNLNLPAGLFSQIGEKSIPVQSTQGFFYVTFYKAKLNEQLVPKITRPLEVLEARWFKLNELPEKHSPTLDRALQLLEE